jgi:predicted ATPase
MILKKSEGNPFYVEEVIRMLIDGEKIAWQDGRWAVTGVIQTLDIPDTLHGVLTARIDRLSEEAKFTLQVASVIGRKFYTEILATVLAENDR